MRRAASLKVQDVQSVFFDLEGFLHYVRRIYRVYREHINGPDREPAKCEVEINSKQRS